MITKITGSMILLVKKPQIIKTIGTITSISPMTESKENKSEEKPKIIDVINKIIPVTSDNLFFMLSTAYHIRREKSLNLQ